MSYQVIARKWRPKNFEELVGQNHVSQTLINALQSHRMPHALLFTGPRGTGKTSTARIVAKSLRCPNAKNFVPCDVCSECQDIAQGRSVDVIEIDGASNNGVDAIRELRETVGYMPSHGKYKVYIIDEVHMLSGSAFNALLKTLEEPPEHVIFVLATTEVQKIPNTILSRCQRFDFRRIPLRMISEHLQEICRREGVTASNEALSLIARQGDGSMRDSQSLLEQVISFTDGQLNTEKVTEVLGLTDRVLLLKTLNALVTRDAKAALGVIGGLYESGHDPALFVKDLLEEIRHLLIVRATKSGAPEAVDLCLEEIEHLRQLGQALSEEDIHLLFDMALKGAQDVLRSQDSRVVLEMLLMRMAAAPRVKDIAGFVSSQPAPAVAAAPAAPTATNSETSPTDKWLALVHQVKKVNTLIGSKLEHLRLISISGDTLQLGIPEQYKFLADQVKSADFNKKLCNYMKTFWGQEMRVDIVSDVTGGSGQSVSAREITEKQEEDAKANLRKQIEKHPLVQSINSHFNVEMTSIKERS